MSFNMIQSLFEIMKSAYMYQESVDPKIKDIFKTLKKVEDKYFLDYNITQEVHKLSLRILSGFTVGKTYLSIPEEEFFEMSLEQFTKKTTEMKEINENLSQTAQLLASVLIEGGVDGEYVYMCGYAIAIGNSLYEISELYNKSK